MLLWAFDLVVMKTTKLRFWSGDIRRGSTHASAQCGPWGRWLFTLWRGVRSHFLWKREGKYHVWDPHWTPTIQRGAQVLRWYNVTQRWCFVKDLPEGFDFDPGEHLSFVFRFYDHHGNLYSPSGQQVPEVLNSRCDDKLEWTLWYTILPSTGCGGEYRCRFCDSQGNVDWDIWLMTVLARSTVGNSIL